MMHPVQAQIETRNLRRVMRVGLNAASGGEIEAAHRFAPELIEQLARRRGERHLQQSGLAREFPAAFGGSQPWEQMTRQTDEAQRRLMDLVRDANNRLTASMSDVVTQNADRIANAFTRAMEAQARRIEALILGRNISGRGVGG
jgi:hypothetical protein